MGSERRLFPFLFRNLNGTSYFEDYISPVKEPLLFLRPRSILKVVLAAQGCKVKQ